MPCTNCTVYTCTHYTNDNKTLQKQHFQAVINIAELRHKDQCKISLQGTQSTSLTKIQIKVEGQGPIRQTIAIHGNNFI